MLQREGDAHHQLKPECRSRPALWPNTCLLLVVGWLLQQVVAAAAGFAGFGGVSSDLDLVDHSF